MPRGSPRNHNSSRSADTEIAARLTTVHIYEFEDGENIGKTKEGGGSGSQGEDRSTTVETSTGFHLLEFHGPTVSNIVILLSLIHI